MTTEPTRDELRSAAEKYLRLCAEDEATWDGFDGLRANDILPMFAPLARHVLATLEAAEAEKAERAVPVDGKWLRELGAIRPMAAAGSEELALGKWSTAYGGSTHGYYPLLFVCGRHGKRTWTMFVYGGLWEGEPTRGAVLDLLAALGVNTKGSA